MDQTGEIDNMWAKSATGGGRNAMVQCRCRKKNERMEVEARVLEMKQV